MITRSLDANGDWTYGRGKSDYLTMNRAVAQSIQTRLMSFLGDCFFDAAAGIDWFNLLGTNNKVGLYLAISAIIWNTKNVTSIEELSITMDSNRGITIQYSVDTAYSGMPVPSGKVSAIVSFLLTEDGIILDTEGGDEINA